MKTQNPFGIYHLDGISLFDDLMNRIDKINVNNLIHLHVVSLSFHQEFISDFKNNVDIYLKDKHIGNHLILKEEEIHRHDRSKPDTGSNTPVTIILSQVTSPETLGFIVHCIESGSSVYVFRKWDYHGTERRSAFSILQRDSIKTLDYATQSEISPWLTQIKRRASDLQAIQTLEFI